jgi:hypothetical protein
MTQEHPITPPPELVVEWADTIYQQTECDDQRDLYVATQAARWGADQELEACCEWLGSIWPVVNVPIDELRTARRPKPPSLKEQALQALAELAAECYGNTDQSDTIRRALEKLDD